jgi:hypothetical protein
MRLDYLRCSRSRSRTSCSACCRPRCSSFQERTGEEHPPCEDVNSSAPYSVSARINLLSFLLPVPQSTYFFSLRSLSDLRSYAFLVGPPISFSGHGHPLYAPYTRPFHSYHTRKHIAYFDPTLVPYPPCPRPPIFAFYKSVFTYHFLPPFSRNPCATPSRAQRTSFPCTLPTAPFPHRSFTASSMRCPCFHRFSISVY